MLLLHLSDLHFGNKNRFSTDNPVALGKAFGKAINAAREESKIAASVSVVIVTGDIAECGIPSEFKIGREFLVSLADYLKVPREQFVFVPGNHDISWPACAKVRAACRDEEFPAEELNHRIHAEKLSNYRSFLAEFYGLPVTKDNLCGLKNCMPLAGGGWLRDFPELKISVAALNTSELENDEKKGGALSVDQAQDLMAKWKETSFDQRIKIVALHHNPVATTATNRDWTVTWLREREEATGSPEMPVEVFEHYCSDLAGFSGSEFLPRIVGDTHVHLVLHGHHHDQGDPISWHWNKDGSAPVLSVGSLGLKETQLPRDVPLSCQFINFDLPPSEPRLIATPIVYDGRFRLNGEVLSGAFRIERQSRAAYDQKLPLPPGWAKIAHIKEETVDSVDCLGNATAPRPPQLYAEPAYIASHEFFGRQAQLDILNEWASPADAHPVLLFEAIGGSGKSMLTWEWTKKHAASVRPDWAGRFWYSFYEKGAVMADFCHRALGYMTGMPIETLRMRKTAELTELLLQELTSRPWLLVLDGLERVLVAYHRLDAAKIDNEGSDVSDQIGTRHPCAAIRPEDDELLRRLAIAAPSKLLLTSRLVPTVLLNQSSQPIPGVVRERLAGLRPVDAEALFRHCGVNGTSQAIQDYLKSHCDCHPLVCGVLAGLINHYLPDRGNFDTWAADPSAGGRLNFANLNIVQKRNHILHTALDVLPPNSRQLLSTLALLTESIDYAALSALNPHLPKRPKRVEKAINPEEREGWDQLPSSIQKQHKRNYWTERQQRKEYEKAIRDLQQSADWRNAQQALSETVDDLESRGLLQYDNIAKRFDLHPVVRGVAAGKLQLEEKITYGQRVIDFFSEQIPRSYASAETMDDVRNGLHVVRTLLEMGRFEQAFQSFQGGLDQALTFNLEAHAETLSICRVFFEKGWSILPPQLNERDGIFLTNVAASALRNCKQRKEALVAFGANVQANVRLQDWHRVRVDLGNISKTLNMENKLALAETAMTNALQIATLTGQREEIFSARSNYLGLLIDLGRYSEAESAWKELDQMGRDWPRSIYRAGTAECIYATLLFVTGKLDEEFLNRAAQLARNGNNRLLTRELHKLRGQWLMDNGLWPVAAESLQQAVRMSREVGSIDWDAETALAITNFHLGKLSDPVREADNLAAADDPSYGQLAVLWHHIGDLEKARAYGLAAYRHAWADGEPYVRRYELTKAEQFLKSIAADVPKLAAFDRSKQPIPSWETDAEIAIEMLKASQEVDRMNS